MGELANGAAAATPSGGHSMEPPAAFQERSTSRLAEIPTLLAGPYGYDGSACEKPFAQLKVGDLNPADIASGKR